MKEGHKYFCRTVGAKPVFSDSEILTLNLAMDYFEFTSEVRYLHFVKANYLHLFPKLIVQSQYNRRSRRLRLLLNKFRGFLLKQLDIHFENYFIIDSTPVITVGYKRDKSRSNFLGSANYGVCKARNLKYFGYKLIMLTDLFGLPYSFELVPANTDERLAADEILDTLPNHICYVIGDKGFISKEWQSLYAEQGIYIWTSKRENQKNQNPEWFENLWKGLRERVEGAFDVLKEGGRSVEKALARTIEGLSTRVIGKITTITLRRYLKRFFQINTLDYTIKI